MQKNRIVYIDYLEAISIILVINIHHLSILGDSIPSRLMQFCSVIAVPIFFMANGMLFFTNSFSFKKHFTKIFYLLLGSMIWKLLIILATSIRLGGQVRWTINQILYELLGINVIEPYIPAEHFWFIYTLIGIYVVAPLFRYVYENHRNVFVLYTVFTFVFSILTKEFPTLNYIKEIIYPFSLGGDFIIYFLVGPLLHELAYVRKNKKAMKIALSMLAIFVGYAWICYVMFTTNQTLIQQYKSLGTFAIVCGMYVFSATIDWKNCILNKIMEIISIRTMGIFAVHMFVSYVIVEIIKSQTAATGIRIHLAKTVIVFVISLIVSEIISYIPGLRRVLGVTHNIKDHKH